MSNKIETWITRFVVVAYGLACLLAAIYESNSKKCDMEKCEKTELVSTEDTNMKQPMCLWLAELQEQSDNPYAYQATDSVELSDSQLQVILDSKNYLDQGETMAMAPFMPIAEIRFANEEGETCILYSFVSCEFKWYLNGNLEKQGLIANPDELYEFLESIK